LTPLKGGIVIRFQRSAAFLAVTGVLGVGVAMDAQHDGAIRASNALNVTDNVLRQAGTADDPLPGSWLSYGRDLSETRYSTLKQIDASNAHRLGLAWSYVLGAGGGNQEGTPLMWNNTLYGITTWSVVFALDARTGKQLWRWDPQIDQPTTRPAICCGNVNRGLAIYNGMIIAPAIDGRLFALDAFTGRPVWETRVVESKDLYTLTSNGPTDERVENPPLLFVFALDGTAELPNLPAAPAPDGSAPEQRR
jgi:glucose dehydrogenase